MGLLDSLDSDQFRLGMGLLAAGGARSDGANAGQRLQEALGGLDAYKANKLKQRMFEMQMAEQQSQIEQARGLREAASSSFRSPDMANAMSMGPAMGGGSVPQVQPGFDSQGYINKLYGMGMPDKALAHQAAIQKDDAPIKLGPGDQLYSGKASGYKPLLSIPEKVTTPAAVQEYQFAKTQGYDGSFMDFQLSQKKAGATNISTRIENKMGDSLASQVGPMAKDSRIQAQGAVKMFDAADRIEKAIGSGMVSAGPLSTQIQTVKQLVQKIGGGNDDGIRQTRQVIKSLAEMSVEARKQLQGQGQVTESEAAAVAKADSGDINDLTIGELEDLVALTKRASHYTAKSHNELLGQMETGDGTKGASKFYAVPGLDTLLKYTPTLPKIGGGDIHSQADAILKGK